jgi:hypothetical protein
MATLVERVTAQNSFESHPTTAKDTVFIYRLICVLRTTGVVNADPVYSRLSPKAVIKRQCFLVDANQ